MCCAVLMGWGAPSRLLNHLPANRATATALDAFLKAAGYRMAAAYGRQFEKLLQVPCLRDAEHRRLCTVWGQQALGAAASACDRCQRLHGAAYGSLYEACQLHCCVVGQSWPCGMCV